MDEIPEYVITWSRASGEWVAKFQGNPQVSRSGDSPVMALERLTKTLEVSSDLIVTRGGPSGVRAGLVTGPDVWEVIRVVNALREDSPKLDETTLRALIQADYHLTKGQLKAALDYYEHNKEDIDDWIEGSYQAELDALRDAGVDLSGPDLNTEELAAWRAENHWRGSDPGWLGRWKMVEGEPVPGADVIEELSLELGQHPATLAGLMTNPELGVELDPSKSPPWAMSEYLLGGGDIERVLDVLKGHSYGS
jgi:hypothetical protein